MRRPVWWAVVALLAGAACGDGEDGEDGEAGRVMFQRAPGGEVVGEVETDVYLANAGGSESDVELLFADGGAGRWSPDGREVSVYCEVGWSPDAERLVCEGYGIDDRGS